MPPKPQPDKWNQPKRWRVRGVAADGLTVTLGRYVTEEEATADCHRLAQGGGYRDLVVQPLEVKPEPEPEPEAGTK
jgi:hypothetical protein